LSLLCAPFRKETRRKGLSIAGPVCCDVFMDGRPSIVIVFNAIPDPRVERTRRHLLADILLMVLIGTICDQKGWDVNERQEPEESERRAASQELAKFRAVS